MRELWLWRVFYHSLKHEIQRSSIQKNPLPKLRFDASFKGAGFGNKENKNMVAMKRLELLTSRL